MRDVQPTAARGLARFARIAVTTLVLAGSAIVAAGWIVVVLLSHPQSHAIGPAPREMHAVDVAIPSGDGIVLRGWFVAGSPGCGAIALLHGVHADRTSMLGRARWLAQAGYAVLLIDFRGHGESGGGAITFGLRESADARAAIEALRSHAPGERVGVIGASMGGAAIVLAHPPLDVDAIQLEQVYPTIDDALVSRLHAYLGTPGTWLAPMLRAESAWHLGLDAAQLRPIDRIADIRAPLFVIAGAQDTRTPPDQSRALYAAARAPKQYWSVAGAGHVDLDAFAGDAYRERTLAFFEARLRLGGASCAAR